MEDPLKQLLLQSGWSYEDVLKKLEQYKNENVIKSNNDFTESVTISSDDESKSALIQDSVISSNTIPCNEENGSSVTLRESNEVIEILEDEDDNIQFIPAIEETSREESLSSNCLVLNVNTDVATSVNKKKGIKVLNHFKIKKVKNRRYTVQEVLNTSHACSKQQLDNVTVRKVNCDINSTERNLTNGQCNDSVPTTNDNCDTINNCYVKNDLQTSCTEDEASKGKRRGKKHLSSGSDDNFIIKRRKCNESSEHTNFIKNNTSDKKTTDGNKNVECVSKANSVGQPNSTTLQCDPINLTDHSFFEIMANKQCVEKENVLQSSGDLIEELNNLFDDAEFDSKIKLPSVSSFNSNIGSDTLHLNEGLSLKKVNEVLSNTNITKESNESIALPDVLPKSIKEKQEKGGSSNSSNVDEEKAIVSVENIKSFKEDVNPLISTTKPEKKKFNTDRLNHITNVLLQKLQNDGPCDGGLKILNVVGGYQSPEHENEDEIQLSKPKFTISAGRSVLKKVNLKRLQHCFETSPTKKPVDKNYDSLNSYHHQKSAIKPTKTNDVTKIKGWKKKTFATKTNLINILSDPINNCDNENSLILQKPVEPINTLKSESSTATSHSAFTSDILDQYLSENASLNISYELPKLNAEQTLKQTYIDITFPTHNEPIKSPTISPPKKDGLKPKTLAEKRMMEKLKYNPFADILENMNLKQRKHCVRETLKVKRKLMTKDVPFTRRCFMAAVKLTNTESSVLYCGKRLSVPSKKENKVIVHIRDDVVPKRNHLMFSRFKRKPRLLQSNVGNEFTYNPQEWEEVQVKLPKVFFEVTPELGKQIHPGVRHFLNHNSAVLDSARVNFALSALKVKNKPYIPQTFVFSVLYKNNQKTKHMKKRILPNFPDFPILTCHEPDHTIESSVRQVVKELLDYCERLDETKSIVKEDDYQANCHPFEGKQQTRDTTDKTVKSSKTTDTGAFKKTAFEMKRLNCKLLSISTGDDEGTKGPCKNEHCALGCVCSNFSNLFQQFHCGRYQCMFKCTCEYKNQSKSDAFPEGILNRLQDEATRNLARVEKEFTQTLIKTNDKLILVGDSERRKRKAKVPKRYNDFIESELLDKCVLDLVPDISLDLPSTKKDPILYHGDVEISPCHVALTKYNFNDIIPFCMVHALYKCYCQKQTPLIEDKISPSIETVTTPKTPSKSTEIKEKVTVKKKSSPIEPLAEQTQMSLTPYKTIVSTCNKQTNTTNVSIKKRKRLSNHSARTKEIKTSFYMQRNKTYFHRERIQKQTKELETQLHIYINENADSILQANENYSTSRDVELTESDQTKSNWKNTQDLNVSSEENGDTNATEFKMTQKRLNVFSIQQGQGKKELKLQRRNTKQKQKLMKGLANKSKEEVNKDYFEFLEKHSSKTRMLPWSQLMTKYENGSYQLWCLLDKKNVVTLTENRKRPSVFHYNLKTFETMPYENMSIEKYCNLVRYVLKKEVPCGKTKDQVLALVVETGPGIWNICGLCEKTEVNKNGQFSASIIEFYDGLQSIMNDPIYELPKSITSLSRQNKDVVMFRKHFSSKLLNCFTPEYETVKKEESILARIPYVPHSDKWMVVPTDNFFSELCFDRCGFVIKFDDIAVATIIARNCSSTVVIKSHLLKPTYTNAKFGIYCDFTVDHKIFIGPYSKEENHDLKFMVSSKNGLIESTDFFNISLTGRSACMWYHYDTSNDDDDDVELIPVQETLIDLTCDSDNEELSPILPPQTKTNELIDRNTLTNEANEHYNPVGLPRYIITNIAQVGYIPAYLHEKGLDVVLCSISKTPRTFSHWTVAVALIQRVMVSKLILVPSTFKLEVTMVEELDKSKYQPFSKTILNGYHIAGEFGVKYLGSVTFGEFTSIQMSESERMRLFHLREKKLMHIICAHMSKLLNIQMPSTSSEVDLLECISEQAVIEIQKLRNDAEKYTDELKVLESKKNSLMERHKALSGTTPQNHNRKVENQGTPVVKKQSSNKFVTKFQIVNNEVICADNNYNEMRKANTRALTSIHSSPTSSIEPPFIIKDISKATVVNRTGAPILPRLSDDDSAQKNSTPTFVNLTIKKNPTVKQYKNTVKSPKQIFQTVPLLTKINIPGATPSPTLNNKTPTSATSNTSSLPRANSKKSILQSAENHVSPMATLTSVPRKVSLQKATCQG